jgi:hypothetical protein
MQHNDVPSCGQLSDKKKNARWRTRLSVSDRLRLNVGIAGKTEIYSWVAENHFADRSLFDLVGYGSLSTGSFNNFLCMIFDSDDPEFSYNGRVLTGARSLVTDEVTGFPRPRAPPPGLTFHAVFVAGFDPQTVAAGDRVTARLTAAIVDEGEMFSFPRVLRCPEGSSAWTTTTGRTIL